MSLTLNRLCIADKENMEPVTRDVYTTIKVSDISNNLCYMSISKLTLHLIA